MSFGLLAASLFSRGDEGAVGAVTALVITLDNTGLVFHDNFNRANSGVVGNGWTEAEPGLTILNNELAGTGIGVMWHGTSSPPDNLIVQANLRVAATGGGSFGQISGRTIEQGSESDGIRIQWNEGLNRIQILVRTGGVTRNTFTFGVNIDGSTIMTTRLVIIDPGSTPLTIKGFLNTTIPNIQDLTGALTEILNSPTNFEPTTTGLRMVLGTVPNLFYDELYACGTDILIQGLASGDKARIIGSTTGSLKTALGGNVSFPVTGSPLPMNMIEVTDSSDVLKATFNAPLDIWGGDSYSVA